MADIVQLDPTSEEQTYCAVHTTVEASLRCNKCDRYMCTKCAVSTPVGYRCRECVRGHDAAFFKGNTNDNVKFGAVCAAGGVVAAVVNHFVPGLGVFLAIILGFPLGGLVTTLALRVTEKRRGRYFAEIGAASAALAGIGTAFVLNYWRATQAFAALVEQVDGNTERALRWIAAGNSPEANVTLDGIAQLTLTDVGMWLFVGTVVLAIYLRFRAK
jgi:hypothetical protein